MSASADAVVVGTGIIGLCSAASIAAAGMSVILIGEHRKGEASPAAAGMLAPSVEKAEGPAHDFAVAARDIYPVYLEELADAIGIRVPLNRLGVLQVALTEKGVKGLRRTASPASRWLDRIELAYLEPTLGHAIGAVMNPDDGAVDNVILMSALNELVNSHPNITRHTGSVQGIEAESGTVTALLADGSRLSGAHAVLAPGAWAGSIDGAHALKAVTPSRGQMVAYAGIGLRHVTYGPRGYLVPRSGATLAGSTMENAGYDAVTTPEGITRVASAAAEIAPALGALAPTSVWAGLRPVTPDMLPILGTHPEHPEIVYASGHSRNGILLAPLTGKTVAELVAGKAPTFDLSQFRPDRF
ncbi:MAG TPA: FAD-dependent oxidoreductase [Gemmatimonadaceae bacterium]|nr:FAD-dependent oxidoreductase [Gemmatimonadaceae bacterium]